MSSPSKWNAELKLRMLGKKISNTLISKILPRGKIRKFLMLKTGESISGIVGRLELYYSILVSLSLKDLKDVSIIRENLDSKEIGSILHEVLSQSGFYRMDDKGFLHPRV